MNRRDFLTFSGAVSLGSLLPVDLFANPNNHSPILVLIKLAGGNDGLNTLVPYQDPLYYQLRPRIGIPRHQVIPLKDGMGLNPYLKALLPLWQAGNLAWIQGIGYDRANLSHFRSIDIWETACFPEQYKDTGWLSHIVANYKRGLHGIIMGQHQGPLAGKDCHSIAMQSPEAFLNQIKLVEDARLGYDNSSLAHLTNIQHQLYTAGNHLSRKLRHSRPLGVPFSSSSFGRKLASIATMIINGVDTPVYKVSLAGFDTHSDQLNSQGNLLYQLADGLVSFSQAMKKANQWQNILIVSYSEFGRRAQENHAGGTDHGTASTHFALGGRIKGGIYGKPYDLAQRDQNGNLYHTIDFRSLYATIVNRWWHQPHPWQQYPIIPFI